MGRRLALDLYPLDHDVPLRAVARRGRRVRDGVHDLLAVRVGDLAEDRVLAVQVRGRPDGDEELRSVGTRAGVGHGEQVRPVELQFAVELVGELVPRTAPPGTGRVTALDHEPADHTMEDRAVVVRAIARLT